MEQLITAYKKAVQHKADKESELQGAQNKLGSVLKSLPDLRHRRDEAGRAKRAALNEDDVLVAACALEDASTLLLEAEVLQANLERHIERLRSELGDDCRARIDRAYKELCSELFVERAKVAGKHRSIIVQAWAARLASGGGWDYGVVLHSLFPIPTAEEVQEAQDEMLAKVR